MPRRPLPFARRWLQWLPKAFTSRRIVRRLLTKMMKKKLGFKGYFDLYNIPFKHIADYDFTEKKSPLQPKGMNRGDNIFDFLEAKDVPYFVSDPEVTEEENRDALKQRIVQEEIEFAFCYWPGLDGLLHRVGNDSPQIPQRLRAYEKWIGELAGRLTPSLPRSAPFRFQRPWHGESRRTPRSHAEDRMLPLKMGRDYSVVYDSTMARFWFHQPEARAIIEESLRQVNQGRIVSDEELKRLRAHFSDGAFGELIFLANERVVIALPVTWASVPSGPCTAIIRRISTVTQPC